MQGVRAVDRSCTAFYIVYEAVLICNDQGTLELTHVLGVDTEVSLQRNFTFHAFRNINEASSGPDRTVQCSELVVCWRDYSSEIFTENFRMLAKSRIRICEDNALIFKVLLHAVIDYLRLILSGYTGKELLLSFRNTQLVKSFLDLGRNFLPSLTLLL
ncbi:hypothetical protein D3C85_1483580 [compost metagenome]